MGRNNAHLGESPEKRLKRFQDGHPLEIIDTLTNSIHSFFNNEIQATIQNAQNPQTSLMILGIHSVALTIAHGFFNQHGENGYRVFLEEFVDSETPDTKFSIIASEIHEWRNVLAHRWLNIAGHNFGYDYDLQQGWLKEGDTTLINPRIYLECYLRAFDAGGKIYKTEEFLPTEEMLQSAKARLISKYTDEA